MKDTKKVNVYPRGPITTINPPIRSVIKQVTLTYDQIRKCLLATAMVEEILPNGKTILLNLNNYNTKNNIVQKKEQEPVNPMQKSKSKETLKQPAEGEKKPEKQGGNKKEEIKKSVEEQTKEDIYIEADSKGL